MDGENSDVEDDDDKMDDEDGEYDTEEESSSKPQPETTVHKLLDLEPPGVRHVQTLRKILLDGRRQHQKGNRDLHRDFCRSVDDIDPIIAPLQTALEESTRMFLSAKCVRDPTKKAKGKNEYDTKTIWIFTNQTNPYSDEKKKLIQNIANEAKDENIGIIVWPLAVGSRSFKNSRVIDDAFESAFFESIASDNRFDHRLRSYNELHDELEELYRTMAKKRRTYHGPMHILRPGKIGNIRSDKDAAIMIDWYSVVQLSSRPGKVCIDSATKKETVKIRVTLEKDTGKEVAKFWTKPTTEQREHQRSQPGMQRFRQFFNFANELIPVTPKDLKAMNKNANGGYVPGLTILGFKPRDSIPFYHKVSKTFLIYPNDTAVKGSENAFINLHAAMLRKDVLAIGEALHRENSQSRLVAIYPFAVSDHLPPGMYVNYLPFEDDMRNVVPDVASIVFDQQKQLRIRNLSGRELPHSNKPGRNNHVGIKIEESNEGKNGDVLFSQNDEQKTLTGNISSPKLINSAIDLIGRQSLSSVEIGEDFENAALTEFYSYLKSVAFDTIKEENNYDTLVNRDLISKVAGKEIKAFDSYLPIDIEQPKALSSRKRTRKIVPDDSGIDWIDLHRTDAIELCTVDSLKKYLRSVGLPISGRKDDLVQRVTKSLEQKCGGETFREVKQYNESSFLESL